MRLKEALTRLAFYVRQRDAQQKNINKSTSESLHILKQVNNDAQKANLTTRAYLSTVFGCPYEKMSPLNKSFAFQKLYLNLGFLNFRLEIRLERLIPPKWKLYLKLFGTIPG